VEQWTGRAGFQGIMEIANSLSAFLRNPNRNYSVDEFKDFIYSEEDNDLEVGVLYV